MIFSYARVSTTEQAADGTTSIAEQHRKNRALATMRGVSADDIAEFTDAGVSGSIALSERPSGKEMLDAAKKGDVIVASKMDRLFRSASDALVTAEDLRNRGIDLVLLDISVDPVTANGTGKMFFGMLAILAEFERDRINERTNDGRRAKKANGGCIGQVPFGYRKVGSGKSAVLVEDEKEQEIVRLVREMGEVYNSNQIAEQLTGMYPTRSGKPWHRVQVRRILDYASH